MPDLRTRLEAAGVSQMELARRLGVAGRTVRYWIANGTPDRTWPEIEEALAMNACPHCGRRLPRVSKGNDPGPQEEAEEPV